MSTKLYETNKSYSFEFIQRKTGKSINEVFLLLPPAEYSLSQGYKVNVNQTAAGAYIDDFGNGFKKISLNFDIWFYWIDEQQTKAPDALNSAKSLINAGANLLESGSRKLLNEENMYDMLSGLDEFFKLRYLFSEARDQSLLTENDAHIHPMEAEFMLKNKYKSTGMDTLSAYAKAYALNYQDIQVIYHDYDERHHYEVVVDQFEFSRSKEDPWSFKLKIELTALKPFYMQSSVKGDIDSSSDLFSSFSKLSDSIENFSGIGNIGSSLSLNSLGEVNLGDYLNVVKGYEKFKSIGSSFGSTLVNAAQKKVSQVSSLRGKLKKMQSYLSF